MAAPDPLDAIALLKADHRAVEALFAKFEAAKGDGAKQRLAEQICMELTVHTKIEEDSSIRPARARWRKTCSRRPMSSTTAPRC